MVPVAQTDQRSIELHVVSDVQIFYLLGVALQTWLAESKPNICTVATVDVRRVHLDHDVGRVVSHAQRVVLVEVYSDDVALPAYSLSKVMELKGSKGHPWFLIKRLISTAVLVLLPG